MTIAAVANLHRCFESLRDLLADLDDADWATPSLCPDWTVHGVVRHLTGIESALAGWVPNPEPFGMFERVGEFMDQAATWPPALLAERFVEVTSARSAELAERDPDDFEVECWTPVGLQTYGRFMAIRVFDCWVHEQDIRVPLQRPGHLDGPAAAMALDEVRRSFGYIAGKLVGVPDGQGVTVSLTGPLAADLSAEVVGGRARVVEAIDAPDARLRTDSLTFMLLCCGRIDPQAAMADGRVEVSGAPDLAQRLATKLRFTF